MKSTNRKESNINNTYTSVDPQSEFLLLHEKIPDSKLKLYFH